MYSFDTQVRVRYGETDQMGYVYYGTYAQYFEVGRVETLRSLGMSYRDLEVRYGVWLPVVSMETRYVRPAFYDDLLTVRTEIRKLPDQHITFYTQLFNSDNKLVNAGTVRLCFFDSTSKKVVSAPQVLIELLSPYF